MTNSQYFDELSAEELMDLFYGAFFALDGIHSSFDFKCSEILWENFYNAFTESFDPIYNSMAGGNRIEEWYGKDVDCKERVVGDAQ